MSPEDAVKQHNVNVAKGRKIARKLYTHMKDSMVEQQSAEIVEPNHRTGRLAGEIGFMAMSHGLEIASQSAQDEPSQTELVLALESFIAATAAVYKVTVEQVMNGLCTHLFENGLMPGLLEGLEEQEGDTEPTVQ